MAVREDLGLKRDELAERLAWKASTLANYEQGRTFPPPEFLERLRELGVSLDWIITGNGHMLLVQAKSTRDAPDSPPARPAMADEDLLDVPAFLRRQTEPEPQQAPAQTAAMDEDLHGRVVEGISTVYKEEGAGLPLRHLGQLAARIHNELMAAYEDPYERSIGLKLALEQLRRELRSTNTGSTSSKRLA